MARYGKEQAEQGRKYIEDRRSSTGKSGGTRFGRGGMTTRRPSGGKAVGGVGGIIGLIIAVIAIFFNGGGGTTVDSPAPEGGGGAFNVDAGGLGTGSGQVGGSVAVDPDADMVTFLGVVMDDTQDVWSALFENAGANYQFTKLVLFEDQTTTDGCGIGRAAAGPFYCPAPDDQNVYIELATMEDLQRRFGAPGDFAVAYIVAHEVGHHIQSITGISDQVGQLKSQNPNAQNDLSVRQELQADCFAGVWGYYANQRSEVSQGVVLDPGDVDEAITAAEAVGDDNIQSQSGYVDPHSFTHGTSAQRAKWFRNGFTTGDPDACDTYSIAQP